MNSKYQIAVIIPAHNESAILDTTLVRLKQTISPSHIYLVNDHSTDTTLQIARRHLKNVTFHRRNQGKGASINTALKKWRLTQRYAYIMTLDADTYVDPNFFTVIKQRFQQDRNHKIAAISGQVTTKPTNWLTAYRQWEYEIGQTIHKSAQSSIGGIIICPGCATVYRSQVFNHLTFPTHSLAEDMDLTFALHRQQLGQIIYEPKAIVHTQDPNTLSDFIKQISRWYTGLWQCIVKHQVPWEGQMLDVEISLMATEGLWSGTLMLITFLLAPVSARIHPGIIALPILLDISLFLLPSVVFANLRHGQFPLTKYLVHFYFLRVVSSLIFIKSFVSVLINRDKFHWFSPHRYQIASP